VAELSEELAGEFVLGVLEADERATVERRMRDEPDFRRSVDAWSCRLMPLSDRVGPVMPPAFLWAAIRQRIGAAALSVSRRQSEGVWLAAAPGTTLKMLHVDPVTGERTGLMRMEPGSAYPEHDHRESEECFVLEGVINIEGRDYRPGDYVIAYAGSRHEIIRSASGGLLLLHWNALPAPV
jgi:quercetin dioxygenase-like cupin family protein